jgi:hypothetical protein
VFCRNIRFEVRKILCRIFVITFYTLAVFLSFVGSNFGVLVSLLSRRSLGIGWLEGATGANIVTVGSAGVGHQPELAGSAKRVSGFRTVRDQVRCSASVAPARSLASLGRCLISRIRTGVSAVRVIHTRSVHTCLMRSHLAILTFSHRRNKLVMLFVRSRHFVARFVSPGILLVYHRLFCSIFYMFLLLISVFVCTRFSVSLDSFLSLVFYESPYNI